MSDRKINVVIDPMGNIVVDAENFQGESCVNKTRPIEEALAAGRGSMTREYKDSWHETEQVHLEQEVSW